MSNTDSTPPFDEILDNEARHLLAHEFEGRDDLPERVAILEARAEELKSWVTAAVRALDTHRHEEDGTVIVPHIDLQPWEWRDKPGA